MKRQATEKELIEWYDEYLDANYDDVDILDGTFLPSSILKALDMVMYRESLKNYIDILIDDELIEDKDGNYYFIEED
jgi:hypothetical protein